MKNIYCNQNIFDSIFSSRLMWTKEENTKTITWISFTALSKSTKVTTQFNAFEFKFVFVENQFYSKAKYSIVDLSSINLFQKNHTQSLRTSLFYIYFFIRGKPETLQKYFHLYLIKSLFVIFSKHFMYVIFDFELRQLFNYRCTKWLTFF